MQFVRAALAADVLSSQLAREAPPWVHLLEVFEGGRTFAVELVSGVLRRCLRLRLLVADTPSNELNLLDFALVPLALELSRLGGW